MKVRTIETSGQRVIQTTTQLRARTWHSSGSTSSLKRNKMRLRNGGAVMAAGLLTICLVLALGIQRRTMRKSQKTSPLGSLLPSWLCGEIAGWFRPCRIRLVCWIFLSPCNYPKNSEAAEEGRQIGESKVHLHRNPDRRSTCQDSVRWR